ncbi:unnamed protein product [Polarella glacialis]|uniref:Chitinase n=2 Tax=Polarella glacialis TaxID=89957 RepID=A0A813F154_POLGL|nr:unnamed protein product [Polarella glacialis]
MLPKVPVPRAHGGLRVLALCFLGVVASAGPQGASAAPSKEKKGGRVRPDCAPELGLVKEQESAASWARTARKFCNSSSPYAEKHLVVQEVLGFIAPWHDHGYKAARYFRGKLSSVSPLWFRVLPGRDGIGFQVAGKEFAKQHKAWADDISDGGPRLLPHFSLEGFDKLAHLSALLEAPEKLAAEIENICVDGDFAGIVFDVRMALFPSLRALLPSVLAALSKRIRPARRLILSVPAPRPPGEVRKKEASAVAEYFKPGFQREEASAVAEYVDAVVVGTSDFSRAEPGPIAPLPWVRAALQALLATGSGSDTGGLQPGQLLLEVPLHGRAFPWGEAQESTEGKVILTADLARVLAKQLPPMIWDAEAAEHSANLTESKVFVSLPSLAYVEARLRLAGSLGVGVALRELGAGFDSVFDLLPKRVDQRTSATSSSDEL